MEVRRLKLTSLKQDEQRIVYMLLHEYTIPEVALEFRKNLGAMKMKVSRIYKKIGVKSRVGLVKQYYIEEIDDLLASKTA